MIQKVFLGGVLADKKNSLGIYIELLDTNSDISLLGLRD